MSQFLMDENRRVVGLKQVLRAVAKGVAGEVFLARDVDAGYFKEILPACEQAGVPVQWIETKSELGKLCGIAVGASAAAVNRPED